MLEASGERGEAWGAVRKQKELRLAVVCFGGVSLAIYMHGVTKELVKLVRASRSVRDGSDDVAVPEGDRADTENIYAELLRAIGLHLDLRVLVDIIAGASAGGINGILVGRALAHDLAIDHLRDLWLDGADVARLLAPGRRARPWSKWFLKPGISLFAQRFSSEIGDDPEARRNLSLFVRSRWFQAPFDGLGFSRLLYRALELMSGPAGESGSLLPPGLGLDLFVTVTDLSGYRRHVAIHDPATIDDTEHRHVLHFGYQRWRNGDMRSDFDRKHLFDLVFAARATGSFPGAFPPLDIAEIDRLAEQEHKNWLDRDAFLAQAFAQQIAAGEDPQSIALIDGSVVNNKPFDAAISALQGRPAYRQIDRRLLYLEPDPKPNGMKTKRSAGFFPVLKGALSDIPRNEPVHRELERIETFNRRVRRIRRIVQATRPRVEEQVSHVMAETAVEVAGATAVAAWRTAANRAAARDAGFAYEAYLRLKLVNVIDDLCAKFRAACGITDNSAAAQWVIAVLYRWAARRGFNPARLALDDPEAPWIHFLQDLDASFRERRLRFALRALNDLYGKISDQAVAALDAAKVEVYQLRATLRQADALPRQDDGLRSRLAGTFAGYPLPADRRAMAVAADRFAAEKEGEITAAVEALAAAQDFPALDRKADALFATTIPALLPVSFAHELLVVYLGFAFWDVMTFSLTNWRDLDEFDEIRIDRISPEDSRLFPPVPHGTPLRGTGLSHFSAFLSRAYRENDYLWGRLNGAERLIDIVLDAARIEGADQVIDAPFLKRRIVAAILDVEAAHLPTCRDLIARLRADLAAAAAETPP